MNLKPVIFVQGKYAYNSQNTAQQLMLLKALQVTQDPKKLREMIGVKTVAEVYRTLDKIIMRKEYHSTLVKLGMDFEYIAKGLKKEIDGADKSSDRLMGLNMLLKSIGLDKYEETSTGGGNWQDALLELSKVTESSNGTVPVVDVPKYDVVEPPMPEHLRLAKEKANKESKGLYD